MGLGTESKSGLCLSEGCKVVEGGQCVIIPNIDDSLLKNIAKGKV